MLLTSKNFGVVAHSESSRSASLFVTTHSSSREYLVKRGSQSFCQEAICSKKVQVIFVMVIAVLLSLVLSTACCCKFLNIAVEVRKAPSCAVAPDIKVMRTLTKDTSCGIIWIRRESIILYIEWDGSLNIHDSRKRRKKTAS